MQSIMYICISLFFITLTLTTLGSFVVGLKFWGILDDDKPVEKKATSVQLCQAWINSLNEDYLKSKEYTEVENFLLISHESDNHVEDIPF